MKKTLSVIVFIFTVSFIYAQTSNSKLAQIAQSGRTTEWVTFKQDLQIIPENIFNNYKEAFGLAYNDEMKILKQESDNIGFVHYRFQQYYKNIPIRSAIYIIHAKGGKAVSGNGKLVKGIELNNTAQITPEQAIEKAISFISAKKYMWQDSSSEKMLKQIQNDPNATYYPTPELVIADKKSSGIAANYKLAYKIDIYASKPLSRNYVFIDAVTGDVLFKENRIMNTDVKGTAVTKYSGMQTIHTDSVSPGLYRLRETFHGNGVETFNLKNGTDYSGATDFNDDDNYWNNVNANQDEVATDAHFAAEKTYEYYFQKFGRLSYDNNNAKLLSYVHYDVNYDNAFWDGTKMTYGDGNGTQTSAFTSLDIAGHEITHGVDEYSANLTYQDESGALNEAFSDIFGTCIKFFADSIIPNWNIGEDIDLTGGNGFRSLSDPKSDQLPDTYHGQYWVYDDVMDNGGVHTNMGPFSHWFFLLSLGGTGTNDNGDTYNVTGIGIDSASSIAYRMLTVYLTPSSDYADAQVASLKAAEDLYGTCSMAMSQSSNAFYAIGVGFPVADNDFQILNITNPVSACGLTNSEQISVSLKYNGCSLGIQAGDSLPIAYRIDGGNIVNDTIILANTLNGGDTLNFSFSATADFSVLGNHVIDCWVKYNHDNQPANDSIIDYTIQSRLNQNFDFGVTKITKPLSSCNLTNSEIIGATVKFYGCDSIAAGDSLVIAYRVNGGTPVKDTVPILHTILSNETFDVDFITPADLSSSGNYTIDAWTEFHGDTLNNNDIFSGYSVKNILNIGFDTIGFEETNINDMILIETTRYSHAKISTAADNTPPFGFLMTGGNALDYIDSLQIPDGANTWTINEFLSAKLSFCVDATSWTSANMRFDLKQTNGGDLYTQYMGPGDYTKASNLRILVNGVQLGDTYNPTTTHNDPFITHFINLDSYAGQHFTLTFETRNVAKDTVIFGYQVLDNAYIDNVCFSPVSQENINEFNKILTLGIYPNPFNDKFTVKFDADKQETVNLEVTDILGRLVYSQLWDISMGTNRIDLNLNDNPTGVYIIKIVSSEGYAVNRLVKKA